MKRLLAYVAALGLAVEGGRFGCAFAFARVVRSALGLLAVGAEPGVVEDALNSYGDPAIVGGGVR